MNNILLVGNGFDLGHELPTSYNDFLFLMKSWKNFQATYNGLRNNSPYAKKEAFPKFLKNSENLNHNIIQELGKIIAKNSWINYYCNCRAEIDGWIDFEREIYPVINLFEEIFHAKYSIFANGNEYRASINKEQFCAASLRIVGFWNKYMSISTDNVTISPAFIDEKYGILKKKIIKELRNDFDEFIYAFELYLSEFVQKRTDLQPLEQIKNIDITHVISFNYTLTESLYGIPKDNVHHIHGMIRENITTGENNMVVGVNEQEHQNMDFIYFVKYFQRIQKKAGVKYKTFVDEYLHNGGQYHRDQYKLYIYGHSLDETDADILKYIIGDIQDTRALEMKPEELKIFYYDDADYEQKVINLIKLYGRPIVESLMECGKFDFIPIHNP